MKESIDLEPISESEVKEKKILCKILFMIIFSLPLAKAGLNFSPQSVFNGIFGIKKGKEKSLI